MPSGGTQLSFGQAFPTNIDLPNLVPSFIGNYTPDVRPLDTRGDERRRPDLQQSYGGGTPLMSSFDPLKKRGSCSTGETYQLFPTTVGSVKLPVLGEEKTRYMPSVTALEILTHQLDTRQRVEPLRYYTR